MRILALILFVLFAARLVPGPVAAQTSPAEIEALTQKAEAGDAKAQTRLGVISRDGFPADYHEALEWLRTHKNWR